MLRDEINQGDLKQDWLPYIPPVFNFLDDMSSSTPLDSMKPINVMCLWDDTDLTANLRLYAPENETKIRSRETADHIKYVTKTTLTEYPMMSRPVLP